MDAKSNKSRVNSVFRLSITTLAVLRILLEILALVIRVTYMGILIMLSYLTNLGDSVLRVAWLGRNQN